MSGEVLLVKVPLVDDTRDDVTLRLLVYPLPGGESIEGHTRDVEELRGGVAQVLEEVIQRIEVRSRALVCGKLTRRPVSDGVPGR